VGKGKGEQNKKPHQKNIGWLRHGFLVEHVELRAGGSRGKMAKKTSNRLSQDSNRTFKEWGSLNALRGGKGSGDDEKK